MRSTNVAENGRKCDYMLNEYDCHKTFRAPLTDYVISRMREISYVFLTQGVHYFRR